MRVVIVGAGYSGLLTALELDRRMGSTPRLEIVLVDQGDRHWVVTEVHRSAVAASESSWAVLAVRRLLAGTRVAFQLAKVERVDAARQCLQTSEGDIPYDLLVVATGARPRPPHLTVEPVSLYAGGSEGIPLGTMMTLARMEEPHLRRELLTFALAGAGSSGVELAGELAERLPICLRQAGLDPREGRVLVIEAAERILPRCHPRVSQRAQDVLTRKGVEVVVGDPVTDWDGHHVTLASGQRHPMRTLVWTGGVEAVLPAFEIPLPQDEAGLLLTDACGRVADQIFAVGHVARYPDAPEPQLPVVRQEAQALARNIHALVCGHALWPAHMRAWGETIGLGGTDATGWLIFEDWLVPGPLAYLLREVTAFQYYWSLGKPLWYLEQRLRRQFHSPLLEKLVARGERLVNQMPMAERL